ncbi:EamA family transporter [Herbiconiux sp. SYSU D00978]|uniref:EamA family transporter n=1 Tax=Herbiconiux sp. SYSU D00978 TaxID=2812562 RepID=UPI001A95B751|nr:EamA family transporter [Herbiconiux sp. SYSU D00978]
MSRRDTALALVVVLLWGANFVVIDVGLAEVPPLLFLAMRFVLVALPAVFLVPRPSADWRLVLGIGAFLSLGQFSLLYAALAAGMPAGLASLVLQVQVLFTAVISALALRERPTPRQFAGIALGLAGLGVVIAGQAQAVPLLPVVLTLGAALSWATGNVLARRAKVASGLSLVVWSALVVPLPALALSLVFEGPAEIGAAIAGFGWPALLSTLYTVIAASLVGYGIWNGLLSRHPSSAVVPFALLVPVVGLLTAWVAQGEVPPVTTLVGGAVMVLGLAVITVRWGRRAAAPVPRSAAASPSAVE